MTQQVRVASAQAESRRAEQQAELKRRRSAKQEMEQKEAAFKLKQAAEAVVTAVKQKAALQEEAFNAE